MNKEEMERIVAPEYPLRADKYPLEAYSAIGRRGIARKDGYEKASGYAVYTTDVQLRGMLWLRILTCPYPHARIKTMDTTRAALLPGVRAVLRYDDPDLPEKADVSGHFGRGVSGYQPVLNAVGYWQGMPMGVAIAAESEEIANEELKLVEIDWEERLQPGPGGGAQARRASVNPEQFPERQLRPSLAAAQGNGGPRRPGRGVQGGGPDHRMEDRDGTGRPGSDRSGPTGYSGGMATILSCGSSTSGLI